MQVLPWLERVRDELHTPMVYVTHAADELARLADHLVVLEAGKVRAEGAPGQVLASLSPTVIVGDDAGVLLQGTVAAHDTPWHLMQVALTGAQGGAALWVRDDGKPIGTPVRVRVLARDVSVARVQPLQSSIQNLLPAQVEAIADDAHPAQCLVRLRMAGGQGAPALLARLTRRARHELALEPGQGVWAQVKSVALV
jgi:molybdate transport system ATP-binding protein